ncbi:pilus assembly protein PilP [Colwellia sp. D2M02]|uniref:pilus assembly protein PilP n=1 Tax=Colwellia sp. D2M02 TaxID=2841562 RepID=UPI001C082136|nr:pilus assembly protein PilP [Colwellia sp. D2M02]MBU2892808.1 pilus assembly protein PilP [Colwellia sp. D2M02]
MKRLNYRSLLVASILSVSLTGCFDDTKDIEAHMEQVKATTTNYIEPMPEVHAFIHIAYSAQEQRSPFVLPKPEVIEQKIQQVSGCLSPDSNRRKQPLEKYALSDLVMKGTLGDENKLWALLEASDLTLHRVSIGNYLGLYHGKITQVSTTKVKIMELSPDGAGCWVEREAELEIVKSEPNK